jgi:hypothetical protein
MATSIDRLDSLLGKPVMSPPEPDAVPRRVPAFKLAVPRAQRMRTNGVGRVIWRDSSIRMLSIAPILTEWRLA